MVVAGRRHVYDDGGRRAFFAPSVKGFFKEVRRKSAQFPPNLSRNAVSILNGV